MSILGFGRKEGRIFMHIKSALNWRAQVSNILCTLSCFFTFIVLPLYILGFAFERENLLQLIWPLSSAWPSLLTILLCFACIRGTCAHREYFAWQFAYILLLLFSFCVILFHYAPKAGKSWTDEADAVSWVTALTTGAVLLMMDVKSIRDKRSPSKDKFDPDVWKLLSYPIFFFLFGSLASVIPGMRSLIKNEDIGITMIALLVVTYPWEVLKAFWDAMKEDDDAETENKLNALCSKVQDASTLASSLQESQNRIEEKVHDIDERLSRTVDDKSGISFLKSNSTYELKITMRRRR